MDVCSCMEGGIPRGFLCGKPCCPQTKAAEENLKPFFEELRRIFKETAGDLDTSTPFKLPDHKSRFS